MAWTLTGTRSGKETQATTRAAPTTDATDGISCTDLSELVIVLEADSGQTLSGAGTLDCYVYDTAWAAWVLVPDAAKSVPASASGLRRIGFAVLDIPSARGRIMYAANSVTVSSGSVTVYLNAFDSKRGAV